MLSCGERGRVKAYSVLVPRDEAAKRETDSFLRRVYRGSVSLMVSALTEKQELSREELDELYEILRKAEEERKCSDG